MTDKKALIIEAICVLPVNEDGSQHPLMEQYRDWEEANINITVEMIRKLVLSHVESCPSQLMIMMKKLAELL